MNYHDIQKEFWRAMVDLKEINKKHGFNWDAVTISRKENKENIVEINTTINTKINSEHIPNLIALLNETSQLINSLSCNGCISVYDSRF